MPAETQLRRRDLINLVLEDLREFRNSCDYEQKYAVDKNIKFFEAVRSLWTFLPWLLREYPRTDSKKIKELADFSLRDGLWERILLADLVRLEKSPMIDLVGPLRNELLKQLREKAEESTRPLVVVNVGCGAMEIERQIIDRLRESPLPAPIVWIGIDNSPASLSMAKENLRSYQDFFNINPELTPELVSKLKQSHQPHTIQFILGDAISSLSRLSPKTLDIVYYSKFLHHLSNDDKLTLKELLARVVRCVIEFDDYRGIYLPLMSLLTNWRRPILLNGAVFSSLRVPSLPELRNNKNDGGWQIKIIRGKGYLKTYRSS